MGARVADRGRNRREPGPGGRQRRAAGHRPALRCLSDGPQPGRDCLFPRARLLGPLLRRRRRPLRAQGHPDDRHGGDNPCGPHRRLRAVDRRPLRGANPWRPRRGDGLSDHPGADHGALVGPGPHEVDRALGGHRRSAHRARPPPGRRPLAALLLGITLPAHAALRGVGSADGGDQIHPRPRQRGSQRSTIPAACSRSSWSAPSASWPSTSWWSRARGHWQSGCSQSQRPPWSPSTSGSAERPPAVRPACGLPPNLLGGRGRGDHLFGSLWGRCTSGSSSSRTSSATRPSVREPRSCRPPSAWCSWRPGRPTSSSPRGRD